MDQTIKKPTPNDFIRRMIGAVNVDNINDFYNIAYEYQDSLSAGGDARYKIHTAIRQRPRKMIPLNELPNGIKNLLIQKPLAVENVFLPAYIQSFVDEMILEWNNAKAFKQHNLGVRNRILLHGITGNGKTTLARHLARISELPFVEISGDNVIDSHVGTTGSNIHNIFKNINEPCILFWDEIDSIGRKRGDNSNSAAGMENERMVNSMLTNLDRMNDNVIFIGATNRMDILDPAFVRRFHVKLELPAPTNEQKEEYAKQLIGYYQLDDKFFITAIYTHECKSYSDIKLHITDLARKYLLNKIHQHENQKSF